MADRQYKLTFVVEGDDKGGTKALKNTQTELRGLSNEFKKFGDSFKSNFERGFGERLGQMASEAVAQIPRVVGELITLGAQVEAVNNRFVQFSGGTEQANDYLNALSEASDGTLDRMGAMQAGAKMLQMQLVDSTDEMRTMAAIAIKLGDQTMGATDRMADFSALLANKSIPRLDNFGIASGRVRAQVELLKQAGYDADQAFKLAVLAEGEKALEKLGDTSHLTKTKLDQLTAAFENGKQAAGTLFAALVSAIPQGAMDWIVESGRIANDTALRIGALSKAWVASQGALWKGKNALDEFKLSLKLSAMEMAGLNTGTEELRYQHYITSPAIDGTANALIDENNAMSHLSYVSDDVMRSLNAQVRSQDSLMYKVLQVAESIEKEKEAQARLDAQLLQTKSNLLDNGIAFASYFRGVEQSQKEYAQTIEEIEAEHQANLNTLRSSGNATDITLENERYAEKLRLAQEQNALQEAEQRRSLGTMLLAQFETWAQMNGVTGEKAFEMRLKIAEEYGLIEDGAALTALNMSQAWSEWANSTSMSTDAVILKMRAAETAAADMRTALLNIPDRTVTLTVKLNNEAAAWAGSVGDQSTEAEAARIGGAATGQTTDVGYGGSLPGFAQGTRFAPGGWAMVGEKGPELAKIPRGTEIWTADETKNLLRNMAQMRSMVPGVGVMGSGGGGGNSYQYNLSMPVSVANENPAEAMARQVRLMRMMTGG